MDLKKGDVYYYAQIIPSCDTFNVIEVKLVSVRDTYFTGMDKRDKKMYLFNNSDLNDIVFKDRLEALTKVNDEETKHKTKKTDEMYEYVSHMLENTED